MYDDTAKPSGKMEILDLLAPIRPGRSFAGGFVLNSVDRDRLQLHFSAKNGVRFQFGLLPSGKKENRFIQAGPYDLVIDFEGKPDPEIEGLAKAVAEIIRRNAASKTRHKTANAESRSSSFIPGSKRIDFTIGHNCISRCIFCSDIVSLPLWRKSPRSTIFRSLAEAYGKGYRSAMLTGLEPTLRNDVPEIIEETARLGFEKIELITNGHRTADFGYLERLFEAGLNILILSIHSMDEDTETFLTQRPGLFERKIRTLKNARNLLGDRKAQSESGKSFRTNTVITKPLLPEIVDFVAWLDESQSSMIPLFYPWVKGLAQYNFPLFAVDYSSLKLALEPLRDRLSDPQDSLFLQNVPLCVGKHFDARIMPSKNLSALHLQKEDSQRSSESCRMDGSLTHATICMSCALRGECPGVSEVYLQHFGEKGLNPFVQKKMKDKFSAIGPKNHEAIPLADNMNYPSISALISGKRENLRVTIRKEAVVGVEEMMARNGFSIITAGFCTIHTDLFQERIARSDEDGLCVLYIGKDPATLKQFSDIDFRRLQSKQPKAELIRSFGRLSGWPACCIEAAVLERNKSPRQRLFDSLRNSTKYEAPCNVIDENRMLDYLPCSPACSPSTKALLDSISTNRECLDIETLTGKYLLFRQGGYLKLETVESKTSSAIRHRIVKTASGLFSPAIPTIFPVKIEKSLKEIVTKGGFLEFTEGMTLYAENGTLMKRYDAADSYILCSFRTPSV